MLEQFIVAPRNPSEPVSSTLQAIQKALQSAPGSRVVSVDYKTGVVVVEIPSSEVSRVRDELDGNFLFDPNAKLGY
jgi:hypothetical protein